MERPLANAGSYETLSQGLRVGTSITFDSPGSKNAINAAIKAGVFSKNVEVSIEDLAEHCVVYNSPHNLINDNPVVSSPHITEPRIVLPTKQVAADAPVQFATESLGVLGYASYLVGKVSSDVINTCAGYLGLTRTLELITNLPGHSLKNFANLCEKPVYQTKGWDTPGDGTLYIDATDVLEEIDSTGTEVVAMSNKPVEDYETVLAFSRDDLSRAHGYNDDNLPLSGGADFSSMVL
ncbi:MAG: hypothetical protein LN588_02150 [Rickettsia endosymbiont of Bryobia graminum]|nr:hypothetical protein [Rickettsia endosymbiont of Bryobia graminum]